MAYDTKIIADSLSPSGKRLTTLQVTLPRIVLAELRTHRMLSQQDRAETVLRGLDDAGKEISLNAASSRAIPVERMLRVVAEDPFIPVHWGKNQKGMQAETELDPETRLRAEAVWREARDAALHYARRLMDLGVHKQVANRVLEPWGWTTLVISATEWANFFAQRCHPEAQPELRQAAERMRDLYVTREPRRLAYGEWHLPYVQDDERDVPVQDRVKLSVARCARVSYLSQEGVRDHAQDFALYDRLLTGGHFSPFEHVATPASDPAYPSGNLRGWFQKRQWLAGQNRTEFPKE